MKALVWTISVLCSLFAGYMHVSGLMEANSAPQQAAVAAMAVAVAIIPYCLARGVSEIADNAPPKEPKQPKPRDEPSSLSIQH